MRTTSSLLVKAAGRFVLFMAGVFLLLFAANLRARLYYHGPNYGFLFWIFLYCVLTGIGLLKHRKWAVLLLFFLGALFAIIFAYSWIKGARVPMPWALLNYGFVAALLGVPILMLRRWTDLRW